MRFAGSGLTYDERAKRRLLAKAYRPATSDCWEFTSSLDEKGYGRLFYRGVCARAHVVAHTLFIGPVPEGYDVHHSCENKCCVNPAHLSAETRLDHNADLSPNNIAFRNKRKTHCVNGHPLTHDNLIPRELSKNGRRECRTCARAAIERWRARHSGNSSGAMNS